MTAIRSAFAFTAFATEMLPVPYNYFGKPPKPKQEPTATDIARIQSANAKRARRAAIRARSKQ